VTRRPVWLLDLDNTLHDALTHIMPRIDRAMTDYVMTHLSVNEVQANLLRLQYWQRYGATLLGMVRHHGVDATHFLQRRIPFPTCRCWCERTCVCCICCVACRGARSC